MSGTRESSPLRVRLSNVSADQATYSFSPLPVQVGCFRLGTVLWITKPGNTRVWAGRGCRAGEVREAGEGLLNLGRCTPPPARCSLHSQRATLSRKGRGEARVRLGPWDHAPRVPGFDLAQCGPPPGQANSARDLNH